MKFSKKQIIISLVVLVVAIIVGAIFMFDSKVKDVEIPESLVKEKVKELLPINKTQSLTICEAKINISNIGIEFEENEIGLVATGDVILGATTLFKEGKALLKGLLSKGNPQKEEKIKPKKISFTIVFKGVPIYSGGSIYLTIYNLEVTELKLENMEAFENSRGIVADALVGVLKTYLDRYPVYKLPDDFKGAMVSAALDGFEFQPDLLIVHLSLWGLVGKMVWMFFGAILFVTLVGVFVMVLIFNPDALNGIMWLG